MLSATIVVVGTFVRNLKITALVFSGKTYLRLAFSPCPWADFVSINQNQPSVSGDNFLSLEIDVRYSCSWNSTTYVYRYPATSAFGG